MTPMDIARHGLANVLLEWRDAGAPVEDVVSCIEGFIMLKTQEMAKAPKGFGEQHSEEVGK